MKKPTPIEILLVEDNPDDIRLTMEAFLDGKLLNNLNVALDGEDALFYLRKEGKHVNAIRPDLILLDLNLPKIDGKQFLEEIKKEENLRNIPVVILTTSKAEQDILKTYELQANCYITKPVDLEQFMIVIRTISKFWLSIVKLPANTDKS